MRRAASLTTRSALVAGLAMFVISVPVWGATP